MAWRDVGDEPGAAEADEVAEVEHEMRPKRRRSRFLADENFPADVVAHLRQMRLVVTAASEAGLLGHPDENYATYALRNQMVLLTCDRDFLNRTKFPIFHCPTIVVLDFGTGSRTDKLRALRCLVFVAKAPRFYDKWTKIDATPDGWTEESRFLDGTQSRSRLRWHRGRVQVWVDD